MTSFIPTNGFPPGAYGLGLIGGSLGDDQGAPRYTLRGNGGRGDAMTERSTSPS